MTHEMTRGRLRAAVAQFRDKAIEKVGLGAVPANAREIGVGRDLLRWKDEFLSNVLSSNVAFKGRSEPDWDSWPSIAETFEAFHAALADIDKNRGEAIDNRLRGI